MRGDVWVQWRNGKRILSIDVGRGKIKEHMIGTVKIKENDTHE